MQQSQSMTKLTRRSDPGRPSDHELRRTHVALFRSVYVERDAEIEQRDLLLAAIAATDPKAYISHQSAASFWGGIVPHHADVHLTFPRCRAQMRGIASHRRKREQEVTTFCGVRVTSPMQTFLDLAQVLTLVDLVVLGDSLVKRRRFTPDALVTFVKNAKGPMAALARRAASMVRAGVDSGMETRTRLLLVLAGLPEPDVDVRQYSDDGNLLRRFDLMYRDILLVIEYDGRQHRDGAQWRIDTERDEALDNDDIRRLVILSADIYSYPGRTLARVMAAARKRGRLLAVTSDEWRRHFPSRRGDVDPAAA